MRGTVAKRLRAESKTRKEYRELKKQYYDKKKSKKT